MSKHTPGPWHWNEGWGAVCAGDDPRNPDMLVTPIWRQGSTAWGDEENNANARLIAAAPDYDEVVRMLVDFDDEPGSPAWNVMMDKARTAIARVEGRA